MWSDFVWQYKLECILRLCFLFYYWRWLSTNKYCASCFSPFPSSSLHLLACVLLLPLCLQGLMKRLVVVLLFLVVVVVSGRSDRHGKYSSSLKPRPHSVTITEFGAVGDGVTLNTVAFQNAIFYLRSFADKGGAALYVPKGKWLTGSFNLTSHLTLFLEKDAVIIGTEDSSQWPVVDPLPSYGQGEDLPGRRYRSLINGYNLTDIVITGENGTIDGKGAVWWEWLQAHTLQHSRPHILEFESCSEVLISNLTFLNSPAWSIHPVYCSNVQIENVIIHSASDSPSTIGIVPDSCSNVWIEDCYISGGHEAISLKSGWDKFGIAYGKPTTSVHINNVNLQSSHGSALAFGSEMSGGISDVYVDGLHIYDSTIGINLKTTRGRGGFMEDIVISNVEMENVIEAFHLTGHSGGHPDGQYDPDALPLVKQITIKNVVGSNITTAGVFSGLDDDPFSAICLSDVNLSIVSEYTAAWNCSDVSGFSESVFPQPCSELSSNSSISCFYLLNSRIALQEAR